MRAKIVLPVLVLGVAIIYFVWVVGSKSQAPAPGAPVVGEATAPPPPVTYVAAPAKQTSNTIALVQAEPTEAERQARTEYIQGRVIELNELARKDDPASLSEITRELDNPEPSIRDAAIEATVQFKSPEAIPDLREALAQATDLDEKVKIQQAIDFLTLMVPAADTNSNQ